MNRRVACSVSAAALLSCAGVMAQDNDLDIEEDTPITIVGCVQREPEYRRQNDSGKGGFLGFGGGLGNEYVLVNASRGTTGRAGDCTSATGGESFELTGSGEGDLERYVGRRVVVDGMLKEAEVDPETGRPTGGRQAGYDLKLFEVDVESFRAASGPVQTDTVTRFEPVQEGRSFEPADGPRDAAPIRRLPRTASPLAAAGLFGLLSLGGLAGLRALYRRDRRSLG